MKHINTLFIALFVSLSLYATNSDFGKITINPVLPEELELGSTAKDILVNKLEQVVTIAGMTGTGFDNRFVIVPRINIVNENTTASIPQKVSLRALITIYIGDGVAEALFSSYTMDVTGVGSNHDDAICSAIRKINVQDERLQTMIIQAKGRIIEYYESNGAKILQTAKALAKSGEYDAAISRLYIIPSLSIYFKEAQQLVGIYSSNIIKRSNQDLITKARSVWSADPTTDGAERASEILSEISDATKEQRGAVERLQSEMQIRLNKVEDKGLALRAQMIQSAENIERDRLRVAEKIASAYYSNRPKVVYHVGSWWR
jgi:cell division septum initiation protein DivIVA